MTKDVLVVSFSAFFADVGYQTAIALFPVLLVTILGASAYQFGIATAAAFGIGSFFGYIGGWMSSKFNDKYVAIFGNALIPLISLMGLTQSPLIAALLFCGGWWARNFRSPSRRVILTEATTKADRGKVFGFLHLLDIGGGALSIVMLLIFVIIGVAFNTIILLTAIPLVISTILLFFTKETKEHLIKDVKKKVGTVTKKMKVDSNTYKGIIIATSLYGFSSYSFGFPILTIAKVSNITLAIAAYGVYLGVSAVTGYFIGSRKWAKIKTLSIAGYVVSGIGTLIIGFGYLLSLGVGSLFVGVTILGFGLGTIETLEPTLITLIKSVKNIGKGMGALAGSRSLGIFSANLIMGILYVLNPAASYLYAAVVSIIAGAVVLGFGKDFDKRKA
jgi:MFS family permease